MNVATRLEPPQDPAARPALTTAETDERAQLREALRTRRSIDCVARAWYTGLLALVFFGLSLRSWHDQVAFTSLERDFGIAAAVVGAYALSQVYAALRVGRDERRKIDRLTELDGRAPKAPELF